MKQSEVNQDYDLSTNEIKNLIGTAERSGKAAWRAGHLLAAIKEQKKHLENYRNFREYCKFEFKKSEPIVNEYIRIYQEFELADLDNFLLISHLREILNVGNYDSRKTVIQGLRLISEERSEEGRRLQFTTKDVSEAVDHVNENPVNDPISVRVVVSNAITERKNNRDKVGARLQSDHFKNFENIFYHEPRDEQGTVALFCVLFPDLVVRKFEYEERIVSFRAIGYIREKFPDAQIFVEIEGAKRDLSPLRVEFEYESRTFFRVHKHPANQCDLIICWNHNFTGHDRPEALKIIELKSVLKTGIIQLF